MNISELTNRLKEICLNHVDIKSFHIGNTWDMATGKASDVYPAVWQEMPVLVEYTLKEKTYTFSLDVLMLPHQDNVEDELSKQSQCEVIADVLLQAFKLKIGHLNVGRLTGLTVKNLNADIATGVRIDIQFITNRECDILSYFKENMDRL